ncbi:hypothetical protein FJTKL_04830 [Diaporthe vaccinii]|uniref:Uncharacterized protein n=1 Tax=Diaporthe vaccinii TaxID=105482 RepID=A0ABR4DSA4_9PEZI
MVFMRNEVESLANSEFDIPYLGLHIMSGATDEQQAGGVKYYARSHRKAWQAEIGADLTVSQEALRDHDSEKLFDGFIAFDPRTIFHIEEGFAMTIIFGTRDSLRKWAPVRVKDRLTKELFERMEAAGVGFNSEFVED